MNPPCQALTVVAPLEDAPDRLRELRELLARTQKDLTHDPKPFDPSKLPDTHFTRFLVIDDPDPEIGPLLVWEANHDGRARAYLHRAALAQPAGLDAIFSFCPGAPSAADPAAFAGWAHRHAIPYQAFHCAYRGVSKREVDAAIAVHREIRAFLDEHRVRLVDAAPVEIERELRAHLRGHPDIDLTDYHRPVRDQLDRAVGYLRLARILRYVPKARRWLREIDVAQQHEPVEPIDRPVHGKEEATIQEDKIRQNQLTHIVDVKPGWFRKMNLDIVMHYIEAEARGRYVHGDLGGISSIHFARWVLLRHPRRDRLLFMSNYDFSWDSYLGEFIDRQSTGLTAVWSNTEGFPTTEGLSGKGSRDEERFKQWTRNRQIPTDLWWSGVPESTTENVRNDVWIRRKLMRPMTDTELTEWLTRL
jgi:hypothetical protein